MVKETSSTSINKKKRKSAVPEAEKEIDIYKKVCEFEEKEASSRSNSVDADIYFQTCQDIQNELATIRDLKQSSPEAVNDKLDHLSNVAIKICVIKKLNRIDKLSHVFGKETLNTEKQKCDSIKLTYQNLVYELDHLVTETNKCLAFKSEDEDIELVSFKEFMASAPKSVTEKFKDFDEKNTDQKHALRLAQLEWELTQRKNLAEECKLLEAKKKKILSEIAERKDKLSNLQPLLMTVLKSTKPLQEHLGVTLELQREEHKLATLLPEPLYIFYVNMVAYKSVYGNNINVVILGDEDEAIQWKEAQEVSNINNQNDESEQESDLPEVEEVIEVKKRRHRKSVQQVNPMEEKKKKLLESHPLKIEVSFSVVDGPTLAVTFHYFTKLKLITVKSKVDLPSKITAETAREILSGDNILSELLENDFGTCESPNPSTAYQLKKVGISSFQSLVPEIGFAFNWAQNVCGIDFLTTKGMSNKLGQKSVDNVMKTLQKRLVTRNHLARQMQQLEQNIIPKIPSNIEGPTNAVSTLSKWCSMTYLKYCQSEFTQALVEEDMISSNDLFYSVNITRSYATLQALVVIKNSYPIPPPIFSLCLNIKDEVYHSLNSDEIRDLERVLNVDWDHGNLSSPWLLSAQLIHLCSYLDVFLESLDPKAFPHHAKFLRSICGRNRRRPFKFRKIGTGIFTQY